MQLFNNLLWAFSLNVVSVFYLQVSVSDVATVVLFTNDTIVVLYRNTNKFLNTNLLANERVIKKLVVSGGTALPGADSILPPGKLPNISPPSGASGLGSIPVQIDGGDGYRPLILNHKDLAIVILTMGCNIHLWVESVPFFRHFTSVADHISIDVDDVIFTPKEFLIATECGDVRSLQLYDRSSDRKSVFYSTSVVPNLHKVKKIFSDPRGENLAFLYTDMIHPSEIPKLETDGRLHEDLLRLLSQTSLDDDLHDVEFLCEGARIPAHKAVLAGRSDFFKDILFPVLDESGSLSIKISETDDMTTVLFEECNSKVVEEMLRYIYGVFCPNIKHFTCLEIHLPEKHTTIRESEMILENMTNVFLQSKLYHKYFLNKKIGISL